MDEAKDLLKYNEDETKVYFFKQITATPEEEDAADRAMKTCARPAPSGTTGSKSQYKGGADGQIPGGWPLQKVPIPASFGDKAVFRDKLRQRVWVTCKLRSKRLKP